MFLQKEGSENQLSTKSVSIWRKCVLRFRSHRGTAMGTWQMTKLKTLQQQQLSFFLTYDLLE